MKYIILLIMATLFIVGCDDKPQEVEKPPVENAEKEVDAQPEKVIVDEHQATPLSDDKLAESVKAAEEQKRQNFVKSLFNNDGSITVANDLVKKGMEVPSSFVHTKTEWTDNDDHLALIVHHRAGNKAGGIFQVESEVIIIELNNELNDVTARYVDDAKLKERIKANYKELIKRNRSEWIKQLFNKDGSITLANDLIKMTLNDDTSYRHAKTQWSDNGKSLDVVVWYRAKNQLGAYVLERSDPIEIKLSPVKDGQVNVTAEWKQIDLAEHYRSIIGE